MVQSFVRAPRLLAVLLLTALAACGGEDDGGRACDVGASCAEYGAGAAFDQLKASCEQNQGRWVASCPTANLLGTCQATVVTVSMTVYDYLGVHGSAAEGAQECAEALSGTWTAAPPIPQGAAVQATVACDVRQDPSQRTCGELSGLMSPERQAALRALCTSVSGVLPASGACPAATHGTCTSQLTATLTSVARYYDAATAAGAQADCAADGGTWSNG